MSRMAQGPGARGQLGIEEKEYLNESAAEIKVTCWQLGMLELVS